MRSVSLPMYLFAPHAVEQLWQAVRESLLQQSVQDVDERLSWPDNLHQHWLEEHLFLSQACGYPLMHELLNQVQLVGSFHYAVPGCEGLFCRSPLLVRAASPYQLLSDCQKSRVAYNSQVSQSGYWSLQFHLHMQGYSGIQDFFSQHRMTGSHVASVQALLEDKADLIALDAVTWFGIQQQNPEIAQQLRILSWTEAYPGLPLISSLSTSQQDMLSLRAALKAALESPKGRRACQALRITQFEESAWEDYHVIRERALKCDIDLSRNTAAHSVYGASFD